MDKQNYPTTIALYSEGKISRAEFLAAFAEWQKANGVDYDCKGGSRWNGLCVTYGDGWELSATGAWNGAA